MNVFPRTVYPHVRSLDLESLPRGQRSNLWMELVRDGMGAPIAIPIIVLRGEKPGPVFGVTAAIHGNEVNGIPVIQRLSERTDLRKLAGTILCVPVVNAPGFAEHIRGFADGTDLNHIMPGVATGNIAQVYAYRFLERVVRHLDFLVDLHTASFGRVNSLYIRADMTNPLTARMAYLQRPQIILHNPASDRTLRGTAMEMGVPAITVEIGNPQVFQQEFIKSSLTGLRQVLAEVGMINIRRVKEGAPPVICASSKWIYTDVGGLLEVFPKVTERVAKGDLIARVRTIFGEICREFRAPEDGIVIGRSVNPVGQTGARILHLGRIADEPNAFHFESSLAGGWKEQ